MKKLRNSTCPKCCSESFITLPNRYDCLRFLNAEFKVEKSEFTDDNDKIFCRECGAEIDEKASKEDKRIVLKVSS